MGWIEQALDQQEAYYKRFNATMEQNALATPLRSTAPGWIFIGQEITCIPDSVHPWDGKVTRAIQAIDPDLVPIWVKYIYKEPTDWNTNKIHVIGRHGIGLVDKTPGIDPNPFNCEMPLGGKALGCRLERPNKIEHIFKGGDDPRASDLPGKYIPFDWEVYKFVKDNYRRLSLKELKNFFIYNPKTAHAEREQAEKKEALYQKDQIQKYWERKMSEVTETEMKNYFLGINGRKARPKKLYSTSSK